MEINPGYCQCGCGEKAPIARENRFTIGVVKGEPRRFIKGHNKRACTGSKNSMWNGGKILRSDGYIHIWNPSHPRANSKGYVAEHILIAEKTLGKFLPDRAVIHHANRIKSDNRKENLVICENNAYHKLLHRRIRAFWACGNPSWRKCTTCGEYDDLKNLNDYGKNAHHPQKNKKCFKILAK